MTEYDGPDFTVGEPVGGPTPPNAEAGWDTPAPRPGRKRRRWLMIGAPVTAAVLAGGAFAAVELVSALSGTDTPGLASALPAKTIAFAQVNLDPNADQKLAMYDIGRKFPKVKNAVSKDDPAHSLIDYFIKQSGNGDDAVTWNDIKSWAGVRVGMALLTTSDTKPYPLLAVQIKDSGKAQTGLAKLKAQEADGGTDDFFFKIDGKYAYASDSQGHLDDAIKDLDANGVLADSAAFKPAAKTVGDGEVLGGYANLAALKPLAKKYSQDLVDGFSPLTSESINFGSSDGSDAYGRTSDGDDSQGVTTSDDPRAIYDQMCPGGKPVDPSMKQFCKAMARDLAAGPSVDFPGGGSMSKTQTLSSSPIDQAQLDKALEQLKGVVTLHVQLNGGGGQLKIDGFGIGGSKAAAGTASDVFSLPNDSTVALGATGLGAALKSGLNNSNLDSLLSGSGLAAKDLQGFLGNDAAFSLGSNLDSDSPNWGVIVHGGDADKAKASLNKVTDAAGGDFSDVVDGSGDTYTIASSTDYAKKLSSGNLGDNPLFKKAVPDAQGSQLIAFVDISSLLVANGSDGGTAQQFSAVGMTERASGDTVHAEVTVVLK